MALSQNVLQYIEAHFDETMDLLLQIAKTPSPSFHEEKRAAFCLDWLHRNGVRDAYMDPVCNVIIPFGDVAGDSPLVVFLSHSDTVFPDLEELPLHTEGDDLYGPGIGDNSTHMTHVLMAARYLTENRAVPKTGGVLLVLDTCEEGLGNLRGCRKIMEDFGSRIQAVISLDSKDGKVCHTTVGSRRYRVEVCTEGGHSYSDFGNRNAIIYLSSLIGALCQVKVPAEGKTTYNIGTIRGGTSVNSIAQQAEMLYEIRSDCRQSLATLDAHFWSAIDHFRTKDITVNVELVGERPCRGDVDEERQQALVEEAVAAVRRYFDLEIRYTPASTDCNIPLSMGIPAVNTGCYIGFGTHTREEHIRISSICPSQKVDFDLILNYFDL